eukprot:4106371-Ditylum_brightwellii.AAC.1
MYQPVKLLKFVTNIGRQNSALWPANFYAGLNVPIIFLDMRPVAFLSIPGAGAIVRILRPMYS